MSARDVADLLVIAHAGLDQARRTRDQHLENASLELAEHALRHPDAATFFVGMQVALARSFRDPAATRDSIDDVLDGNPSRESLVDGRVNARSPVDAGCVPHDGRVEPDDVRRARELEPAVAMVTARRAEPRPLSDAARIAATRLA